jgi:hypothetical protein
MKSTQFVLELLHTIGADIEDKFEIYAGAAEAASGKLQAIEQIRKTIKVLKKEKELDNKTVKLILSEISKMHNKAEKDIVTAVSKRDAFQETVGYLARLKGKLDNK